MTICNGSFGADDMWVGRGGVCVIKIKIAIVVAKAGMTSFHAVAIKSIKLAGHMEVHDVA